MRDYEVQQTSLECRWIFNRMLPSLPGPGTPAFAELVKELQPFGIQADGITVDASSARLSEVVLGIALLDRRVAVRLTVTSFDFFVNGVLVDDEVVLPKIASCVMDALRKTDSDSDKVTVKVRISSHLSLQASDLEEFLNQHLRRSGVNPELVPDALAYNVTSERLHSSDLRSVIARSITFESALFFDISSTYRQAPDIPALATWISEDFDTTMEFLGLAEKKQP